MVTATEVDTEQTSGATNTGKSSRTKKAPAGPKAPKAPKAKREMSAQHKEAIAEGREQSKAIDAYLNALATNKPKRGRKVKPEDLQAKLEKVETDLQTATGIDLLNLTHEANQLRARLEEKAPENDIESLKDGFIAVARAYATRKKMPRSLFVSIGVPADVLKAAGF